MAIDWNKCSKEDGKIIMKLADRAWDMGFNHGQKLNIIMDVKAAHIASSLRLQDLLDANDSDFTHDMIGIAQHVSHATGKMLRNFHPRFAVKEKDAPCTT